MSALWIEVLSRLKTRISEDDLNEWLLPAKILKQTEKAIIISVPDDYFIDWIHENYSDDVNAVLTEMGFPNLKLELVTEKSVQSQPVPTRSDEIDTDDDDEPEIVQRSSSGVTKLNPKYLFDSFVVGNSNQFAHAASLAVAEAPSNSYNPLFLYGGSGLGKTHLLHAIGHKLVNTKSQQFKICYTTCEEFTNQFINSIRFNRGEAFRERFRSVDVLLIDDIQFLSGKTQTQEEFFHTFNALFERQKQIILSSDRPPSDIPKLESRLTSRFQWGLIADIQPPALETRIAILKKKASVEKTYLSDDVLLYIANKVKTNVRELEGALVKLLAYSSLTNRSVDLGLAETALRNIVKEEEAEISYEKIMKLVAERYNITPKEMIAKNNSKRVAEPRQLAMYLTRQLTGMSLPEIGVAFGKKHHSTVLYSIQKIEKKMASSPEYQSLIAGMKKSLQ